MNFLRCLGRPAATGFTLLLILACYSPCSGYAQQYNPQLFDGMRWRLVGPFRGGRALATCGVPGHPDLFYFGAVDGGVWKSTDAGRVWKPIFDSQPIGSIGALAVAPSNPEIIYVGSGEADMRSDISYGNGLYKSTDGGRTWKHIGLEDTRQIGRILIDPHDPNRVFVAALGHAYGPNTQRGVFRSTDGGKTWQKVLYKDENTGAIDLAFDPANPRTIYAALWQTRRPPWSVYPPSSGPGSGLYESTDGGDTWKHLTGHGLPSEDLGRIGIGVARSNPNRIYLIIDAKKGGLYRSDDAGKNWQLVNSEQRLWGRGWYFGEVTVDPKDENTVYVPNTAFYRSHDGGKTFTVLRAAPGGDDYHNLWIDPEHPQRMIVATDQGVIITVNDGKTWSSWYNQPTAQLYHIITDNRFPYWIYGAQQDSGSVAIISRSPYLGINSNSWLPISVGGESEYIAPDPFRSGRLYGGTGGTGASRYNLSNQENQNISPALAHPGVFRSTWTLPLVHSPLEPKVLYFGSQVIFRTIDGGDTWQIISPDLTRENPGVPANLDAVTAADTAGGNRRGVVYTIAPSPLEKGTIWAGTDDGLIQLTRDAGRTWQNVTPPGLAPWSKISIIEASHFDRESAYAAVDRHRLDDLRPYIYRTHDAGKTWQEVSRGIPVGAFVRVVREDPERRGLLYAGTETGVYVSFDGGDHWQPLQLNLPAASVRDLDAHGDDLVAGTHGRSIWILDDLTPLRQLGEKVARSRAWLFKPQTAYRIRYNSDEGTPLPKDEPAGENPPNGAIIDYYLKAKPAGPVLLEIYDADANLVKRYSSAQRSRNVNPSELDVGSAWVRAEQPPSAEPGMHRFVWDLFYPGLTPPPLTEAWGRSGLWALPGQYTVKLIVDGKSYSQPLTLRMDPRVQVSLADLQKQFDVDQRIIDVRRQTLRALGEAKTLAKRLRALQPQAEGHSDMLAAIQAAKHHMYALAGPPPPSDPDFSGEFGPAKDRPSLRHLDGELAQLQGVVESAAAVPTPDALTAIDRDLPLAKQALSAWVKFKAEELAQLNSVLRRNHLPPIVLEKKIAEEN